MITIFSGRANVCDRQSSDNEGKNLLHNNFSIISPLSLYRQLHRVSRNDLHLGPREQTVRIGKK